MCTRMLLQPVSLAEMAKNGWKMPVNMADTVEEDWLTLYK